MEKKNNSFVIILMGVIIVILAVLCVLFATDTISFKSDSTNNNEINENINEKDSVLTDNVTDSNNGNQNQEENSNEKVDDSNFIRETRITLVDEPNCTGNGDPLIAAIEPNGNISIAQNRGAAEIEVGNAKYLYRVGIIACDNFKLYYITENKELYVLDNPNSTALNQKATKVTDNKVVEFLGVESKSDGSYLKVLLDNGKKENIKYFSTHN